MIKIKTLCISFLLSISIIRSETSAFNVGNLDESYDFNLYINQAPITFASFQENQSEIKKIETSISHDEPSANQYKCTYAIKKIYDSGKYVLLEDESLWLIGRFYRDTVNNWKENDQLKIFHHSSYSNNIQLENINTQESTWGINEEKSLNHLSSFILSLPKTPFDPDDESTITLNNKLVFKGPKVSWKAHERIFIFHSSSQNYYKLWNLDRNEKIDQWSLINKKEEIFTSILNIENQLNQQVLGQEEAIKSISSVLINCLANLNDPQQPLGVFLFLGPSGVGKTELSKALTQKLYKNPDRLIRFDMSHFASEHDKTRLIGSPPGYIGSLDGGQLTNAIKAQPLSIVLLDEIEKAHPSIRKIFLPIFDEGSIRDSQNKQIKCNRIIFIMTSNLCSNEITFLFEEGYTSEEIIKIIEPILMQDLSPELYNRVIPITFNPITPEIMEHLVHQKLKEVIEKIKNLKDIDLIIDKSVQKYLEINGYHPSLGVRPLKRLIQKKIISFISYAIIQEDIPERSTITLSYSERKDIWNINWTPPVSLIVVNLSERD